MLRFLEVCLFLNIFSVAYQYSNLMYDLIIAVGSHAGIVNSNKDLLSNNK